MTAKRGPENGQASTRTCSISPAWSPLRSNYWHDRGYRYNRDNHCDGDRERNSWSSEGYDCLQVEITAAAHFVSANGVVGRIVGDRMPWWCSNIVGWDKTPRSTCSNSSGNWFGGGSGVRPDPGDWQVRVNGISSFGTAATASVSVYVTDWGDADYIEIEATVSDFWHDTGADTYDEMTFRVHRVADPAPVDDIVEINMAEMIRDHPAAATPICYPGGYCFTSNNHSRFI